MLHRYENGPFAANGIWQRHVVPAALHFDANVRLPCRFEEGEGDQEKCSWGILWGPTQIPSVLRVENKNSMGAAPTKLAPSIDAPSATQKDLWQKGLKNMPPSHAGQKCTLPGSAAITNPVLGKWLVEWFFSLVMKGVTLSPQRELTPTGNSRVCSSVCMKPVYTVACGWD